jgi:hypothetical protein
MVTRADFFEALCRAGMPPSRAETVTREVAESGLVRRGPLGRPRKRAAGFSYTAAELVIFFLALGALAPADCVGMPLVLAEHRPDPDPEQTTAGAIDDFDMPLPVWLKAMLESFGGLSDKEWRAAYRQASGAFIEFTSDPDHIGDGTATTVRAEWGPPNARFRILWRSPHQSLRTILGEPDPDYRATTTVRLAWRLLLDLTTPAKKPEPENESAEILAGTPAPIDQPITIRQPTGASNTLTVAKSERVLKR